MFPRTLEPLQLQVNATPEVTIQCADAAVTGTNVEDTATTAQVFTCVFDLQFVLFCIMFTVRPHLHAMLKNKRGIEDITFETKAKDFEAKTKTKNFKNSLRGLHDWLKTNK